MIQKQESQQKMLKEFEEKIKALPVPERKKAVALYGIFKQMLKIVNEEDDFNKKEYDIYNEITAEITGEMDSIIEGKRKINEEEIEFWKKEEPEFTVEESQNTPTAIKGFWKEFIVNGEFYYGECDLPILEHLTHIESLTKEDANDETRKQITISFTFSPNEYFENEKLDVKLNVINDEAVDNEFTPIKWKNNPTVKVITRKQKNKRTGQTRTINKETQKRSFFEIFSKYEIDDEDELTNKDYEEDNEEPMNIFLLETTINDFADMIPYSLEYYLDVRPDEDDEVKTNDENLDEIDEEDDDDLDDDDQDEDLTRHKFKSRKNSENKPKEAEKKGGANTKQECKQQ